VEDVKGVFFKELFAMLLLLGSSELTVSLHEADV
jgi:hypothetical protein